MANIEELVGRLALEAAPVKPAWHPYWLGAAWLAGAAVYLTLSLWLAGLRPDLIAKLHDPLFAAELAALALIFVTANQSAAMLAFPDLHQMRKTALAPVGALTLFLAAMILAWLADTPPARQPMHSI